ncbi:MAG: nuclear transport factor 2 family protein [Rhizobiaceae bacterium]|nr:MAG: nuclear transport factor 2 family protein [Rhizobiaceae bacterium]
MDPRLQEMLDHYEISKTLNEYCHSCDRCDVDGVTSVYVEDSWDDHGAFQATGPDFARAIVPNILETSESMYHLLGQSMINVTGDEAGAETYFLAGARMPGDDGELVINQLGGRFVDRLERVDGAWKIKHRTVVRDWTIAIPLEKDWVLATHLKPGLRSNDDPSYAALGRVHGDAVKVPA